MPVFFMAWYWASTADRVGSSTQHGKGQDDATELGLLEVAAQRVGDGPDVGRRGFAGSFLVRIRSSCAQG
jgi:hypothetical protein